LAVWAALVAAFSVSRPWMLACAQESQPGAAAASAVTKIGAVKSINGSALVLKVDGGVDLNVTVQDSTRILRLAPGQSDLKSATPVKLDEVQVGDRMMVRGAAGNTADSILATRIVVMKQTDVAQQQQQQLQDWQKRGVGGIVTSVDAPTGSISIAVTPALNFVVKTFKDTGFLRYAPDSVKFADAHKGTFDQIKVGDQLRARGNRSPDGKEVAAEEVISGVFRNIAGTVTAIDVGNSTLTVKDILGKKTVAVKITAESQMRKLPAPMAQRIAFVLKGSPSGSPAQPAGGSPAVGGRPDGGRPNGPPDFQQMIGRLPEVKLADLQKDEAVMIVSTQGNGTSGFTAITLLSGVEPILTASPDGMSAAALLSGWNLSAPGGDAGPQ
jgi:hypothetical protein